MLPSPFPVILIWKLGVPNSIFYRSFGPLKYTERSESYYLFITKLILLYYRNFLRC
nr:MAG TPA: hypothetical protein [Caudoviricetes sp.]